MKTHKLVTAISAVLVGTAMLSGGVLAKGSPGTETAANNLSLPVILGDNVTPAFPVDNAWKFADITDPGTQCIGEGGVPVGSPVPPEYVCYYGRYVDVDEETGDLIFIGNPKVWWLQKRPANFWKVLSTGHDPATPLAVSAVDVGDLLESSPKIQARQIRVEFNLLQHVDPADPDLGQYVVQSWGGPGEVPEPCVLPTASGQSLGCFAALAMSGAVPGTQQSGNEMQGTDFGPGTGTYPGTRTLINPATVKLATPDIGGVNALVYSRCARLVIQKIGAAAPTWDPAAGRWTGVGVGSPVAEVAAYGTWGVEVTSGGSIVYGYNWNAKSAPTGTYRMTFVLDSNATTLDDGTLRSKVCTTPLLTTFDANTLLVNPGDVNTSYVVPEGDPRLNGGKEGGLAYMDVALAAKGGGRPSGRGSGTGEH